MWLLWWYLVTQSLDLVLVQFVLTVAGLHGGGEPLHLSVQDTHHIFKSAGFNFELRTPATQLGHLGLLAVELELQRRSHRAGQGGEGGRHRQSGSQGGRRRERSWSGWTRRTGAGGWGGGGGSSLHGRPRGGGAKLGDSGLELPEGLLEFHQFVSGEFQSLGLQALHAHFHAHDVMQQQVEVLVGVGALMVVDLFLFHLQKQNTRVWETHLRNNCKTCVHINLKRFISQALGKPDITLHLL